MTSAIILDTGNYLAALTVTATGEIAPTAAGVNGISAPSASTTARVTNFGTISGGVGEGAAYVAYAGGNGIDFAGGGVVGNHGLIEGGAGGAGGLYGGNGGAGVALSASGTVTNAGTIIGGSGGTGGTNYGAGGNGGTGIALMGGGIFHNAGLVTGGAAGSGSYPSLGGIGVYLGAIGTITNTGTITGGAGAGTHYLGNGGAGVDLAGGTLVNAGLITGGAPRADGVEMHQAGMLRNTGSIIGGPNAGFGVVFDSASQASNFGRIAGGAGVASQGAYTAGGDGGTAMLFRDTATVVNNGILAGGAGGDAIQSYGGEGGIGLILLGSGTVSNAGTIEGGASGLGGIPGKGGIGVQLQLSDTLTNFGTIEGGNGLADQGAPTAAGLGGTGIYLLQDSDVVNHGLIAGGESGYGGYGIRSVAQGSTLLNTGTVEGGAGLTQGGIGVYLNGGTLTNMGTIAGGAGAGGALADAVRFGQYASTLAISQHAVFEGGIAGNANVDDTIVLSSHGAGTLAGLGTSVTGITNFVENAGADWTLSGSLSGTGALDIGAGARLLLDGAANISTIAFAAGGYGTLILEQPALAKSVFSGFGTGDTIALAGIRAASVSWQNDTLTVFGSNHAVLDKLEFSGNLSANDFLFFLEGKTTEIIYAAPDQLVAGAGSALLNEAPSEPHPVLVHAGNAA